MKHCVIMTVYTDICQVNRFISTIPEDWDVYVHVDKKSDINVKDIIPKAYSSKIFNVYWAHLQSSVA